MCWSWATCAIACTCATRASLPLAPTSCRCSSRTTTDTRPAWGSYRIASPMHLRLALALATGIAVFAAQAADAPTQPAAPAAETRAVMTGDQVVQILDETVDWYRTLGAQQQAATQPSDLLILYANRQTADQIKQLDDQRASIEEEIEANKRQLASTPKQNQATVQTRISVLKGQLDLVNARR